MFRCPLAIRFLNLAILLLSIEMGALANPLAALTLEVTDTTGNPISQIATGQSFELREFVQDLRPSIGDNGVFAAYSNIQYEAAQADVAGSLQFSGPYDVVKVGDISQDGRIQSAGAVSSSISPLGTAQYLLLLVPFVAQLPGELDFATSADHAIGHDILLYGIDDVIPPADVLYGTASVMVVPEPGAMLLAIMGGWGLLLLAKPGRGSGGR